MELNSKLIVCSVFAFSPDCEKWKIWTRRKHRLSPLCCKVSCVPMFQKNERWTTVNIHTHTHTHNLIRLILQGVHMFANDENENALQNKWNNLHCSPLSISSVSENRNIWKPYSTKKSKLLVVGFRCSYICLIHKLGTRKPTAQLINCVSH